MKEGAVAYFCREVKQAVVKAPSQNRWAGTGVYLRHVWSFGACLGYVGPISQTLTIVTTGRCYCCVTMLLRGFNRVVLSITVKT